MSPNILGNEMQPSGSLAPRAGFAKITAASEVMNSQSASQVGTPVPVDRTKVAFGFGTKRKAEEDGSGTPPTKRR